VRDDGERYGLRRIGMTKDDLEADARRLWRWSKAKAPSLPIREWLPRYRSRWLRPDLIAATAVWAVLVPEGMAYASLAGLPPETGLFAALAPLLAYAVLGTSRQLNVGPSSGIAAFSAAAVAPLALGDGGRFIALSALLALLVGGLLLLAGLIRLGFIVDFFARPVLTGFVTGLALVVAVGQLPKLFGVEGGGTTFFGKLETLVHGLGSTSVLTLLVGLGALAIIFGLRAFVPKAPSALVAVVVGIAVSAALSLDGHGVAIIGDIPDGLPTPTVPSFSIGDVTDLLPDAVGLALICFAESVAGARAFAAKHGYEVDPNQELVALGVSNIGAGLLRGFTGDASLSRSAVADSAGQKTQIAGIVLFGFLVVTMLLLMPLFHDLPEAVLAAIVIAAVAHLVDVKGLQRLLHLDRTDFGLALVCLAGVLIFGLLTGLVVAVVASLLALVFRAYRPSSSVLGRAPGMEDDELYRYRGVEDHPEYETVPGLVILRVDGELFFANARWFCERVRTLVYGEQRTGGEHEAAGLGGPEKAESRAATTQPVREVLVQAGAVPNIDTTAAAMLYELIVELHERDVVLSFARVTTSLYRDYKRNGIVDLVGEDRFFDTVHAGVADFNRREWRTVSD
jgi:SulP family sulfate permease